MYKIGVIGDYDSICGFSALGLDTYPVSDVQEAAKQLRRLAEGEYGVLFVTEPLLEAMPAEVERYRLKQLPAIVPIPHSGGTTGYGVRNVRRFVEQAVGSDILFGSNG